MCSNTPSHRQSVLQDRVSPSETSKTPTSPRSPQTKKASLQRNPNSSSNLSTSSKKNNRTSNSKSHRNLYTGSSSRHSSSLSIEVCRRIPDWLCEGSSSSFIPRIPDWFNNRDTLLNRWMRKWVVGCHTRGKWAGCTCLSSSRMMMMSILMI
jgi:hypothetical protein